MKIRKQTYSLEQYLKQLKNENIRTDQDCQRRSEQWKPDMVSELIATVLTENYIPPIILGEESAHGITKQWLIDGLQRSTSLSFFRYGNTRIVKNLDEFMIHYQRKILDENGNPQRDENGEIVWATAEFDIRNKTYNQLPEELQEKFNGFQLETVIYMNCEAAEISKLVRKFNNHVAMNTAQKAFTYADAFAREVRGITENRFFLDVYTCSRNDRKNGTLERLVGDTLLLCSYPEQYRKDTKKAFKWMNENASIYDFESLNDLLTRLTASVEKTKDIRGLFNSKHAHIFVAAFKAFTGSGHEDKEYGRFLEWFVSDGNQIEVDGKTWDVLDVNKATRDSAVVHGKLDYLVALFGKYFKENQKVA